MNLDLSPDELAFQSEVRGFLDASLTPELRQAGKRATSVFMDKRFSLAWQKILHARGWTVAKYLLEFERGGSSGPGLKVALDGVVAMARAEGLIDDPAFRAKLASAGCALEAVKMTEHRVMAALAAGNNPGPASSMLKTQGTETLQMIDELALEAAGPYAAVDQIEARAPGANLPWVGPEHSLTTSARYLNDRAASIYGGSNEIQRDIMARLVLGL
ncbi:MAG: acyl-CoA dehydrogenase family protein [Phenylobacterium sp.]|nr:acyl-CoA dehydrogenase family protein [Phenylobacterium sp.]